MPEMESYRAENNQLVVCSYLRTVQNSVYIATRRVFRIRRPTADSTVERRTKSDNQASR